MTRRQEVLANITAAAFDGDERTAIRLYCENRISMRDYQHALARGQKAREELQQENYHE